MPSPVHCPSSSSRPLNNIAIRKAAKPTHQHTSSWEAHDLNSVVATIAAATTTTTAGVLLVRMIATLPLGSTRGSSLPATPSSSSVFHGACNMDRHQE